MSQIVLSIDLEDWFHILDEPGISEIQHWGKKESRVEANTDRILQILSDHDRRATFFCLGWVAERHPDLIRRIGLAGHELASHSYSHTLVYTMSRTDFTDDARRGKQIIEDISGLEVIGYRAPGFSVDASVPWYFDALSECGFKYDSSIFRASRAHGGWEDFDNTDAGYGVSGKILEIPLEAASILGRKVFWSGGGYFRVTPAPLHKFLARRTPNTVFYLHPRDLDVDQPRLELSTKRSFKYYAGLASAETRLRKFLDGFEFKTCRDVWSESLSR